MTYYDNNATYISNTYNREARFRAIAMNAVREAVAAFGRHDYPFTDNDAAVMDNVFLQLRSLGEESSVNRQQEHQAVSYTKEPPSVTQATISQALDKADNEIRAEAEPVIKAKLPTAKA